jgi:hypothetical protein
MSYAAIVDMIVNFKYSWWTLLSMMTRFERGARDDDNRTNGFPTGDEVRVEIGFPFKYFNK